MAVLVTGGAGYVGAHVVLALLDSGEQVVVLDDLSTGFDWAVPGGASLVVGDVADERLVPDLISTGHIELIIHCAAKTSVPELIERPLYYYYENVTKTLSLLRLAVANGVRHFIFSSTAAVYGEPGLRPVDEDRVPMPLSPYGRSELVAEWILSDACRAHGLQYVALRYFNVAGADPKGRAGQSTTEAGHLIKVAARAALGERQGVDVFGDDYSTSDGSCLRDFIHVTDLSEAHVKALDYLRSGGESVTCNCGYGHGYSVLEVLGAMKEVTGVDFPVKVAARRAGDAAAVVASNERIRKVLGWEPNDDDLREIVRQAFDWERRGSR